MTVNEKGLEPCPYCGEYPLVGGTTIWCANKACWGPHVEQYSDIHDAIAAWNRRRILSAIEPVAASPGVPDVVKIAHDGFEGDIIGRYVTREGKRGVVVQQHDTRVVHVYGEKWLSAAPTSPEPSPASEDVLMPREPLDELCRINDVIIDLVKSRADPMVMEEELGEATAIVIKAYRRALTTRQRGEKE